MSRLKQDQSSTQEQVKAKEAELNQARIAAEELTKKINYARELLNAFNCPVCGAPLVKSDCSSKGGVDHECKVFMCGCKILDGTVIDDCLIGGGAEVICCNEIAGAALVEGVIVIAPNEFRCNGLSLLTLCFTPYASFRAFISHNVKICGRSAAA